MSRTNQIVLNFSTKLKERTFALWLKETGFDQFNQEVAEGITQKGMLQGVNEATELAHEISQTIERSVQAQTVEQTTFQLSASDQEGTVITLN